MSYLSSKKHIVELLDLPDEMILTIMNKVKPKVILLCSMVNIGNDRLEQLAIDKCHSIDLSFDYWYSPYELLLRRFYSDVLPRIYNNIQSLIISLKNLMHIHSAVKAIDNEILPNLKHLTILSGRRRHHTGTSFAISFHYDSELHNLPLFSTVPQFVYIEGALIDPILLIIRSSPLMRSIKSFEFDHDCALLVPTNHEKLFFAQSSYLTNVSITLCQFSDCVRLLNQLDSQIYSFTIRIVHVYQGDEDIVSQIKSICCCNLKQLKMIIYRNILGYENCVLPLLQHLSSIEHLTLLLAIKVTTSSRFIDGSDLEKNIISYMPNLSQFNFHIRSTLQHAPYIEVDTIRQSFIREKSVDCILDYFNNEHGQCQIYSLPFIGDRLDFVSNRFPLFDIKNTFINVTMLLLFDDVKSFENIFFERVTRALPRLRTLEISNQLQQQEETTKTTNLIEFSHLSTLILHKTHMDYGEQLLCRSSLPHLVELVIHNDILSRIINQDDEQAKNNCSKVETLFIVEPWIEPTDFHLKYFPTFSMRNS